MNVRNRGYFKIKDAVSAFDFDFRDKIVLDIGSSTGGFTQFALDRGAKEVIAVEKGTNQMAKPLRYDPRVELHEKTNIFSVRTTELSSEGHPQLLRGRSEESREDRRDERPEEDNSVVLIELPDVIIADVSFISLTKVLAYTKGNLADTHTEFLVMLKPQFEARPDQLNSGIVKNERIRRDIIKHFERWLGQNGFIIQAKRDNSLKGKTGKQERFYYLRLAK